MYLLIASLFALDALSAAVDIFWVSFAILEICWKIIASPRIVFQDAIESNTTTTTSVVPAGEVKGKAGVQVVVLISSRCTIHTEILRILLGKFKEMSTAQIDSFLPLLVGDEFDSLADSIVRDGSSPILVEYGISLGEEEIQALEELIAVPTLVLTPPEDGDRMPRPGERRGPRMKLDARYLSVPKKVSKSSKKRKARERRRQVEEQTTEA